MLLCDAVRRISVDVIVALMIHSRCSEKYVQAAKALTRVHALEVTNPELHVRLIDFRKTRAYVDVLNMPGLLTVLFCVVSSLPEAPAAPVGPVIEASLKALLPDELSLEVFNSQYLQRHPGNAKVILAAAKSMHRLNSTMQEVEDTIFGVLNPEVNLDVRVSCDPPYSCIPKLTKCLLDCIGYPGVLQRFEVL